MKDLPKEHCQNGRSDICQHSLGRLLCSRRFKAFSLSNQQLIELMSGKAKATNLPDDAEMLTVNWDHWRGGWFVKIASKEFDEVEDGHLCPELILSCERI